MTSVELSLDQHRLLESLGLGLMVLSVSIGLLSIWLNKNASQNRLPFAKPAMLLAMLLGVALLLLTILVPPHRAAQTAPPARLLRRIASGVNPGACPTASGHASARTTATGFAGAASELRTRATSEGFSHHVSAQTRQTPILRGQNPTRHGFAARAAKPANSQKVPNRPEVKPETAKESHKANIFSARCSRLLEKVGSGEPMSNAEQQEMVTKCQ
jgi:type IV secretory pathway TrbL component